jgi:hypothetical protein
VPPTAPVVASPSVAPVSTIPVATAVAKADASTLAEKIQQLSQVYSQKLSAAITNPTEMTRITGN